MRAVTTTCRFRPPPSTSGETGRFQDPVCSRFVGWRLVIATRANAFLAPSGNPVVSPHRGTVGHATLSAAALEVWEDAEDGVGHQGEVAGGALQGDRFVLRQYESRAHYGTSVDLSLSRLPPRAVRTPPLPLLLRHEEGGGGRDTTAPLSRAPTQCATPPRRANPRLGRRNPARCTAMHPRHSFITTPPRAHPDPMNLVPTP